MITATIDMNTVNPILMHPDIWPDIAPVGWQAKELPHAVDAVYHLVNDGDGVVIYHPFRDGLKIHPNFLPSKRGKLAYISVEESILEMFSQGFDVIYAEIDPRLRNVVMFARRLGFSLIESGERDLFLRRKVA